MHLLHFKKTLDKNNLTVNIKDISELLPLEFYILFSSIESQHRNV